MQNAKPKFLNTEWFLWLITWQKKAQVEVIDQDGWSALHHACFGGHLGCVQLLLDNQVPVDSKDKVQAAV